jgi:hypothetical protein
MIIHRSASCAPIIYELKRTPTTSTISVAEKIGAHIDGSVPYYSSLIDSSKCIQQQQQQQPVQHMSQTMYDNHLASLLSPLTTASKSSSAATVFSSNVSALVPIEIENQMANRAQKSSNEQGTDRSESNSSSAFSLNGVHHMLKASIVASPDFIEQSNYRLTTPQNLNSIELEAKLIDANNNNLLSRTLNTTINSNLLANTNNEICRSQQADYNNSNNSNSSTNNNNNFSYQLNMSKFSSNQLEAHAINNFSFQQNLQSNNESWPISHQQQKQQQQQQCQKSIRWSFENQQQYRVNLNLMSNSWKEFTKNFVHYKPY